MKIRFHLSLQFDFTIFSYHEVYLPGVPNYSWTHLKLPVQIACSAVPLVLYTMVSYLCLLSSRNSYFPRIS